MAHFQATVRLFDVVEEDVQAAERAVEERLRTAGFTRWQIARVGLQAAIAPAVPSPRRVQRRDATYAGGGLLIAAVAAWALWILWVLAG